MVLPIIIGVGATVVALTVKSTLSAYRKFVLLTPLMVASLNGIRLVNDDDDVSGPMARARAMDPNYLHQKFLRRTYPNTSFRDPMTEQEALLVLGIEGNDIITANRKLVRDRYRKLMILNHPDKNGSQYISQRINQAKDVLDHSYMFKNEKEQ